MVGTLGIATPPLENMPASGQLPFDLLANGLTTPDPVLLQQSLRRFVTVGIKACAVEASSIGIEEHRLAGTHIRVAVSRAWTSE